MDTRAHAIPMPMPIPMPTPTPTPSRVGAEPWLALVREDFVAHGRRPMAPGFQALFVHRLGVARLKIEPRVLRAPVTVLYRALARTVASLYGIELPYSATIGRRVVFEHQHGIVVHGAAVIGDDCIIRQGVTLGMRSLGRRAEAPVLGRGVEVGAGAKILGRVRIGDGAAIGANAVVLHDVPAGAHAAGVPARIVPARIVFARAHRGHGNA